MKEKAIRIIHLIPAWVPAILCAVGIYFLSAQNGEMSAALSGEAMLPFARIMEALFGEAGHTVFRKFAHFFAYCALMFFTYFACYRTRQRNPLSALTPFGLCVLYAVSDEVHQYFVPERACRLFDVGVDTLGCVVGGLCFYLVIRGIQFIKSKRRKESKR